MPAENDPADPNALMQSLQLTCSLTPSSTEPSRRLVIIWLRRCWPGWPMDPARESAPVAGGGGGGGAPNPTPGGVCVGGGATPQSSKHSAPAAAGDGWICTSNSQ